MNIELCGFSNEMTTVSLTLYRVQGFPRNLELSDISFVKLQSLY